MSDFDLHPQSSTEDRQESCEIQFHLNESTTRKLHVPIVAGLWAWPVVDCAA